MIALGAGPAGRVLLRDRVAPVVPQRHSRARPLLDVAESGRAVLAPPAGARPRVIARRVVPGPGHPRGSPPAPSPLALADVRPPAGAASGQAKPVLEPARSRRPLALSTHRRASAWLCTATSSGGAHRLIRPSCCSSGKAGRPQCLPGLRAGPAGSSSPPARASPPPRAQDAHGYRRPGHPHHEPSEPADQPSPAPARAIWPCRHDAGDPGFLAGPGDRLVPVGGPAQRHGGETPAARARASRTSPRAAIAAAPDGGPGKAAELRLLEWETAAPQCGGSPATATLPCAPSWASGSGFPGRRTHIPARLCVPGGPALRPETGSLR